MPSTHKLFNLTQGPSIEIYGNGDIGNCILFKLYMLFHPDLSANEAAEKSGIFKDRLIKPHSIENAPTSAAEYVLHANSEKESALALFKSQVIPKIGEWFKADLAVPVISGLTEFAEILKKEVLEYDELEFSIHNFGFQGIESDDSINVKETAGRTVSLLITEAIQACIDMVKMITGQKQIEDAKAAIQEQVETMQNNYQQSVAGAQEAAKEAAANSALPVPFVTFDPNPVPKFDNPEICKHFVFDKFCKIPAAHHESFRDALIRITPTLDDILTKGTGKSSHTFKLLEYWNPHMFYALKVNKKGEYIIGKDAILLSVNPTLSGADAVVIHNHDSIVNNLNSEFFKERFGEEACKKATADPAQLLNKIYTEGVSEEDFLKTQMTLMQNPQLAAQLGVV